MLDDPSGITERAGVTVIIVERRAPVEVTDGEAMNLSPENRLTLAEQQVTSVATAEHLTWEQAWLEELDLRLARARQSPATKMSWNEVQQRLRSLAPR